jgi:hypothetical protein
MTSEKAVTLSHAVSMFYRQSVIGCPESGRNRKLPAILILTILRQKYRNLTGYDQLAARIAPIFLLSFLKSWNKKTA